MLGKNRRNAKVLKLLDDVNYTYNINFRRDLSVSFFDKKSIVMLISLDSEDFGTVTDVANP